MIRFNFEDAKESLPVKNGRYNLTVTAAEVKQSGEKSKNPGRDYLKITLGNEDDPSAPLIYHSVPLPHETDEKKSADFKTVLLKRFLYAFKVNLPSGEYNADDLTFKLLGARGYVEVKQGTPTDSGDVYNELVLGKVPNEPGR